MQQVKFYIVSQAYWSTMGTGSIPAPVFGTFYYVVEDVTDLESGGDLYLGVNLIGAGLTMQDIINYFENPEHEHTFPGITAGDILPKSTEPIEFNGYFDIQTTGGDADLSSGPSELKKITGNLYDSSIDGTAKSGVTTGNLIPFKPTTFVSTEMNLIDPDQKFNTASYYFPVYPGNLGTYGTTQGNNGYIIVGTVPESVKFCEGVEKPTSVSDFTVTLTGQTLSGQPANVSTQYYAPQQKGWMMVTLPSAVTPETNEDGSKTLKINGVEVGCHVAWSNYRDDDAGVFLNHTKNISAAVTAVHEWGLAAITSNSGSVSDEISLTSEGFSWVRRIDRVQLNNLSWTRHTVEGETTTYYLDVTLPEMKEGGLWTIKSSTYGERLTVEGNTITISDATSTETVQVTDMFYYQLDEQVTGTGTGVDSSNTSNDFGLTYFLDGNNLTVPVKGYVVEAFSQSGKDQLFNAVTYQKIMAEVVATALCELNERLKPIEYGFENGFQYIKVVDLDATGNLNVGGAVEITGDLIVHGNTNIAPEWIELDG